MPVDVVGIVLKLAIVLVAITVHEAAHAWSAEKMGDPTGRNAGRISLNPLVHLDPVGTVLVPILLVVTTGTAFGWAKPVPVNPNNFHHHRRDMMLTALAGPGSNLVLAAAVGVLAQVIAGFGLLGPSPGASVADLLVQVLLDVVRINVFLAVFNLIPIPPLDGSRVVPALLPDDLARSWDRLERYGFLFFFLLVFVLPSASGFDPLGVVFHYVAYPLAQFFLSWAYVLFGLGR